MADVQDNSKIQKIEGLFRLIDDAATLIVEKKIAEFDTKSTVKSQEDLAIRRKEQQEFNVALKKQIDDAIRQIKTDFSNTINENVKQMKSEFLSITNDIKGYSQTLEKLVNEQSNLLNDQKSKIHESIAKVSLFEEKLKMTLDIWKS